MKQEKTIVLGIDGAPWEYIDPLLRSDRLPHLNFLIKKGSRGVAKSTFPAITSVAWSSFYTGKDPKNTGIFDWCIKDGNSNKFRHINSLDRIGTPFWQYISENGKRIGLYNLPMTFPPEEVNGFFISGFDSPLDCARRTYPKYIYEKISRKYGDSVLIDPDKQLTLSESGQRLYTEQYIDYVSKQTSIALELIDKFEVDVFVNNFMILDHLNHRVKDYSLLEKSIIALDRNIGIFLKKHPDANYIIFSDHGSNRIRTTLMIYNWLEKMGFVVFNKRKLELVRIHKLLGHILRRKFGLRIEIAKIIRYLLLSSVNFLPTVTIKKIVDLISSKVPGIVYEPHNAIDLQKSKIFYCSVGSQGFYFNVKDNKNSCGVLSQEEYQNERENLINCLLSLEEPETGKKLYDWIAKKEEICPKHFCDRAPDLIAHSAFPFFLCSLSLIDKSDYIRSSLFHENSLIGLYGQHTDDGICIFSGPAFRKRNRQIILHLKDLAAYIIFLAGVPIPDDFDGRIIEKDLFSSAFLSENTIETQLAKESKAKKLKINLSKDEEANIKEQLTHLGYM